MQNAGQMIGGFLLGAVITGGIFWGFYNPDPPPASFDARGEEAGREAERDDAPVSVPPIGSKSMPGVEAELRRLILKIADLEAKIDAMPRPVTRTPVGDPIPGMAVVDEESLVRALERVEEKKLDALTVDELLALSQKHVNDQEPTAARKALEAALTRELEPKTRARAMTQLGIAHRSSGDYLESARVLQDVVDSYGLDSSEGTSAAYQLVWTHSRGDDKQRALQLASTLAGSPQVSATMRIHARWSEGVIAERLGDRQRARTAFEAILRDGRDMPNLGNTLDNAKQRLEALR